MTHVLLPSVLLVRRGYGAAVVGAVLAAVVGGRAVRAAAAAADVPRGTVRGWVDRARSRAELLRGHFTAWAAWLDAPVETLDPAGSPLGDAVAAVLAAADAARERVRITDPWVFASAATGGRLLCNTSSPFPAPWSG